MPAVPPSSAPRVSVLISAWRAEGTIARCLAALVAQTFRDFEVVLSDSSPDEETARIASQFPTVRLMRSTERLYSHEARNRAVANSSGALLVSLDADVYADPQCLARLVETYDLHGGVVVGSLRCYGRRLRDLGMHFCKFAKFLPGGAVTPIDTSPTANMLVSRADYERAGGFHGERYLADAAFARTLLDAGSVMHFAPAAVVEHHHTQSIVAFLRERFDRGSLFGRLRIQWLADRRRVAIYLAGSVLPIRIVRIVYFTLRHARRAGLVRECLLSLPLTISGHLAWLAGESAAYAVWLLSRGSQESGDLPRATRTPFPPVEQANQAGTSPEASSGSAKGA
jgi:glycosyltransferase involved in cell wall biosynthesis